MRALRAAARGQGAQPAGLQVSAMHRSMQRPQQLVIVQAQLRRQRGDGRQVGNRLVRLLGEAVQLRQLQKQLRTVAIVVRTLQHGMPVVQRLSDRLGVVGVDAVHVDRVEPGDQAQTLAFARVEADGQRPFGQREDLFAAAAPAWSVQRGVGQQGCESMAAVA